MKHGDAGDFAAMGGDGPLLACQVADGPFAGSKVTPDAVETVIGNVIWRHKGRANPISNAKLQAIAGLSERAVKGVVEQLVVTHRMRIGAARVGEATGYYVIVTAEDLAVATGPYLAQIVAMFRRLKVLMAAHELRELLGQLTIEGGGE